MPVKLPNYTDLPQVGLSSQRGIASYKPGIVENAVGEAGDALTKVGLTEREKQTNLEKAYAEADLMKKQTELINSFDDDQNYGTFVSRYADNSAQYKKAAAAKISDPDERALFEAQADVQIARSLGTVQDKAKTKRIDDHKAQAMSTLDDNKTLYNQAQTEEERTQILSNSINIINAEKDAGNLNHVEAYTSRKKTVSDLVEERLNSLPPEQQIGLLKQTQTGIVGPTQKGQFSDFQSSANYIMDKFEGGGKLVRGDGGKGYSKFGVNQVANPDLDIPNLTRAQAEDRYKKYWNEINADKLPENMRLAALDTAINFGSGKANQMIAQSNNDPQRLIAIRKDEHARLAQEQPDRLGKYADGWAVRDNSLAAAIPVATGGKTGTFIDFIEPDKIPLLMDKAQADYERQIRLQQQAQTLKDQKTQGGFLGKFYNNELTTDEVMKSDLPAFGSGSKQEFMNIIKKGDNVGNASLHRDAYEKILTGEITEPSQLIPYITRKDGLSTQEAQNLQERLNSGYDHTIKTFTDGAKSAITGSNDFVKDPEGDQLYSAFLFDMDKQIKEGQKKGLTAVQMLDPSSKDYIGQRLIGTYARTPEQRIQAMASSMQKKQATGDPNLRQSGESLAAWLQRTKK